jgi:hypothetical protein
MFWRLDMTVQEGIDWWLAKDQTDPPTTWYEVQKAIKTIWTEVSTDSELTDHQLIETFRGRLEHLFKDTLEFRSRS